VTELQVTARVFRSTYSVHLTAKGLAVCPFSGTFLYDLPFCRYIRLWSHPPYFRNFDNVANTVAKCFSPLIAKRYFSLPISVGYRSR